MKSHTNDGLSGQETQTLWLEMIARIILRLISDLAFCIAKIQVPLLIVGNRMKNLKAKLLLLQTLTHQLRQISGTTPNSSATLIDIVKLRGNLKTPNPQTNHGKMIVIGIEVT